MTGQHTLEDVGVKRTRQGEENESKSHNEADNESKPQSKKAHTESVGPSQSKDSMPSRSKENQGSSSNAAPQQKPAAKDKAVSETKQSQNEPNVEQPNTKQEHANSKQPATETEGEANPKAPLSTAVAKPEGLVEEGRIYFFYRPRVSVDHPTSVGDIQRFFMILAPSSRPKAAFRLLIIGKKRLPVADKHERFFGFVEATADKMETLTGQLGQTGTQPPTRGYNTTEPARCAGEGVYEIVNRDGRKTSFAYRLEIPQEPGEVQDELQIKKEASFTLSMKNPSIDDPPNAGLSNKADYKGGQKKQFGNYRWISCQDASLLDAERCEFILIGATEDLQGQMGEGGRHLQQAAIDDVKGYMEDVAPDGVDEHDALIAKLRDETNAAQSELPTEAAATGKWQ